MIGGANAISSRNHAHILAAALSAWPPSRTEHSEVRRGNVWRARPVSSATSPWADRVLAYHW
ncbi:hypothetical protein ABTP29_17840, partial [Acinetobacter baumannii]